MTATAPADLLGVVAASLAELRAGLRGDAGHRVIKLGGMRGGIPDLVRGAVRGAYDVLTWLRDAVDAAAAGLVGPDAMAALVELGASVLDALGETSLPAPAGLPAAAAAAIEAINGAIRAARGPLDAGTTLVAGLPRPQALAALRQDLRALVGEPGQRSGGELGQLLDAIT